MPVFGGRLGVEDLRHDPGRAGPAEDPVRPAAKVVFLFTVGKREIVGGIKMAFMLGAVARRRGEAMIEKAQPAAGDMRHHRIKDLSALFIRIEAVVEKHLQ